MKPAISSTTFLSVFLAIAFLLPLFAGALDSVPGPSYRLASCPFQNLAYPSASYQDRITFTDQELQNWLRFQIVPDRKRISHLFSSRCIEPSAATIQTLRTLLQKGAMNPPDMPLIRRLVKIAIEKYAKQLRRPTEIYAIDYQPVLRLLQSFLELRMATTSLSETSNDFFSSVSAFENYIDQLKLYQEIFQRELGAIVLHSPLTLDGYVMNRPKRRRLIYDLVMDLSSQPNNRTRSLLFRDMSDLSSHERSSSPIFSETSPFFILYDPIYPFDPSTFLRLRERFVSPSKAAEAVRIEIGQSGTAYLKEIADRLSKASR